MSDLLTGDGAEHREANRVAMAEIRARLVAKYGEETVRAAELFGEREMERLFKGENHGGPPPRGVLR